MPFSGEWQAPAAATGPLLTAADTDSWMAVNRAWKDGKPVWRDPASGDFSLTARAGWQEMKRPRIGALPALDGATWMKAGRAGCWSSSASPTPPCTIADIQAGDLRQKFDVIVFADQPAGSIENGYGATDAGGVHGRAGREGRATR